MNKLLASFLLLILPSITFALTTPWAPQIAKQWYANHGWQVGSNYIPANAINQLEMWQAESFSPNVIDHELAIAEHIGMNSMRVFLHDLPWAADPVGFSNRIDAFLQIASRHHIRIIFVLFDSCWNPQPHLGLQSAPVSGVHNSGWVQSPGVDALLDVNQRSRLANYVRGVVARFGKDPRVLAWDVWNEPDGLNLGSYGDPQAKAQIVQLLLPQVFEWARSAHPMQPLTSPLWTGDWSTNASLNAVQKIQISLSDIISFHSYEPANQFEAKVISLQRFGRPVICTEYMARTLGSTIQTILPIAKRYGVAAYNWGFVAGKTQTYYPWDSWQHPYPAPPPVWFHDLFYPNGLPYDVAEVQIVETLTLGHTYPTSLIPRH